MFLKLPDPLGPGLTLRRRELQKQAPRKGAEDKKQGQGDARASSEVCLGTRVWKAREPVRVSEGEDRCVHPTCGGRLQGIPEGRGIQAGSVGTWR